jgi:hypothetical protein
MEALISFRDFAEGLDNPRADTDIYCSTSR